MREKYVARRILVVEDNPDLAGLLVMHLRDAGYACSRPATAGALCSSSPATLSTW